MSWILHDADLGDEKMVFDDEDGLKRRALELAMMALEEPISEAITTMSASGPDGRKYRVVCNRVVLELILDPTEEGPDPTVPMVTVRFFPQVWINDYAVPADAEGPTEFRVPERDAKDEAGKWLPDRSDESDVLREHARAPKWIRDWHGPFEIEILWAGKD